jgi:hypothetical protein
MSAPKQSIPKVIGTKRRLELYDQSDDELDLKSIKVDSDAETVDLGSPSPRWGVSSAIESEAPTPLATPSQGTQIFEKLPLDQSVDQHIRSVTETCPQTFMKLNESGSSQIFAPETLLNRSSIYGSLDTATVVHLSQPCTHSDSDLYIFSQSLSCPW